MFDWETRLTTRDTNRIVRPFEWGIEWTRDWPQVNGSVPGDSAACESFFHRTNDAIIADSERFFGYEVPVDFRLEHRKVERFHTGSGPAPKDKKVTHADFL